MSTNGLKVFVAEYKGVYVVARALVVASSQEQAELLLQHEGVEDIWSLTEFYLDEPNVFVLDAGDP